MRNDAQGFDGVAKHRGVLYGLGIDGTNEVVVSSRTPMEMFGCGKTCLRSLHVLMTLADRAS